MTAFLTPYSLDLAQPVGTRLFRKRILPIGEIEYEGQRVQFDEPFLQTLVSSFRSQAYDQVPFQLATSDNKHNNDPEKFRGEVAALELGSDGLYATVSTTDEGAKVITDNPNLGISARIVNGLKRADGKTFKAAMQHVLGTLDPMINGLGPWEAIEASHPQDPAIDLTSFKFAEPEADVAQPQLTEEELTQLRALLGGQAPDGGTPPTDATDVVDDDDDDDLTDEQLNALIAEAELFAGDDEDEPEVVAASTDPHVQAAIQLANARMDEQSLELARVTEELDESTWEKERAMFATDLGIPPAALDLAEPLLKGSGHVVELANGSVTDAGAVMRRVLTEIGQTIKILDLSAEAGTTYAPAEDDEERDSRSAFVSQYRSQTGI